MRSLDASCCVGNHHLRINTVFSRLNTAALISSVYVKSHFLQVTHCPFFELIHAKTAGCRADAWKRGLRLYIGAINHCMALCTYWRDDT